MGTIVKAVDKIGKITKRPPIWGVVAGGLVWKGGPRGREAALRGGVGYGVAAVLANFVIKPLFRRPRPAGAGKGRIGPLTSSFPSGHAATDLAFVFGVSQALPVLFLPLSACTAAAHWSLVRTRAHHVSDVLAGGAIGIGVAFGVRAWWPDKPTGEDGEVVGDGDRVSSPGAGEGRPFTTTIDGDKARLLVHVEGPDKGSSDGAGSPLSRPDLSMS